MNVQKFLTALAVVLVGIFFAPASAFAGDLTASVTDLYREVEALKRKFPSSITLDAVGADLQVLMACGTTQAEISDAEARFQRIEGNLTRMSVRTGALEAAMQAVKADIVQIRAEIIALKETDARHDTELQAVRDGQALLTDDMTGLKTEVAGLRTDVDGIKRRESEWKLDLVVSLDVGGSFRMGRTNDIEIVYGPKLQEEYQFSGLRWSPAVGLAAKYRRAYSEATVGVFRDEANAAQGFRFQARLGVHLFLKQNVVLAAYMAYEDLKIGSYKGGSYDLAQITRSYGMSAVVEAWRSRECVWTLAPYVNIGGRDVNPRSYNDGVRFAALEAFAGIAVRGGKPMAEEYCRR